MRRPLHLYCGLLSIVAFALVYGDDVPDVSPDFHIVENYREENHTSYTSVKSSRAGVKGHRVKGKRKTFKGGCTEEPVSPINGYLTCSSDSGCRANCKFDYKFPNGEGQLVVTCSDGKWNIRGTDWTSIPHCEPHCMPPCQNNGICTGPNECDCPDVFSGPQCQFKNEPCLNPPPPVKYAEMKYSTKTCTVACQENFIFPNGAKVANLICKNGIWESTRSEWVTVPDCQPICSPPCQNGGNCLPLNMCQCPQNFLGPQCQFSSDVCAPEKMGFNGGYRCEVVENGYACTLNCPPGVDFTAPPASQYLCAYEKGYFEPQPIPQCQTNGHFKIIPVESTRQSFYQITNHTWSFEDVIDISSHKTSHHQETTFDERDIYGLEHSMVDKNGASITGDRYIVESKTVRPEAKTCFTWGGVHYKTFDGTIYNFESTCAYTLIQETRDNAFTVTVQNSPGCKHQELCSRMLKIFVLGKEYSLAVDTDGMPIFRNTKKNLPIPARLTSLRVEMAANFVITTLDSVGLTIKWDKQLFVQIEASESLWNRTTGLCGRMNGDSDDDLVEKDGSRSSNLGSLTSSWRVERIGETCDESPNVQHSCASNDEFRAEAKRFCSALLADPRFRSCSGIVDLPLLENACQWDYCACKSNDRRECACHTMNVYVRQCAHQKIVSSIGWRRNDTCPITCSDGRVYMACGPKTQPSCSTDAVAKGKEDLSCEEGCFCPDGTVLHEGKCISVEQCPCRLRGKSFQPGASVPKGCNTCTCLSGKWLCTQTLCSGRCAAVGDPHYVTFDGKHYDFMGKCNYYLLKGNNYSIESENVACSGAISESMGYSRTSLTDVPSCTKSVTIRSGTVSIKLKQNRQILVNGEDVTKLPIKVGDMKLRIASSIFLIVNMPNGLEVWWDSVSRVYINAPADFRGKTSGLCGTFTANQKDDFLTPDGDVEQSVVPFANKWKTNEICLDSPPEKFNHPCDANPQKRSEAKKQCSKLWSDLFSECHWHVDPEPFYKDCMFDMCACETSVEMCLCPTIAAYAAECASIGVKILWRHEIEECKIHCSRGQEYQICGNSCTRSCGDISFHEDCKHECVEGCNCPDGQSLDVYGECIPIGQCPCSYAGLEFRAGYREVRSGLKSQELCTCAGGRWNCLPATPDDVIMYPAAGGLTTVCTASKNLKISSCEPVEPRTCRNMHEPVDQTPAVCKPGCVCKDGYVKDLPSGICVKKEECPCYHGGKSYREGSSIQEECNTCKCEGGKWNCTDRPCAGICSAWGDSHYKTFDGRLYDFQGVCDYVLVKAHLSPDEVFEVSTQNVPCGSSGVTCSKSITFSIGNGAGQETITLTRGKAIPKVDLKRIAVRKVGLFVFLDCPDLGVVVQWDEGTRVYVKVHPKWRGHTKGLCGDYNDNSEDDYKTPSGGVSEVLPRLFADSWKKEDYCAEPKDIVDTCAIHPERKSWATEKCGVLKTSLFQSCHSEVELEPYLEKCIFDTCACDAGGDCECLCTALAAYAHECNIKGVPVKWRSQELCPMQCDVDCSMYTPCMSACPLETCENSVTLKSLSHLCSEDTCVEGCQPKGCPVDQVYKNDSLTECVPKETCKLFCMNIDGITYYEADEIKADSCQSCFCSHGKIVCSGTPCTTVVPETSTVLMEQTKKCIDGWSAWISKDSPAKGKRNWDIEFLPSTLDLLQIDGSAVCTKEQMVDIKCRSVDEHKTPKETGLNVECSLERGLYCEASADDTPCIDFEISVLCRCYPLNVTAQVPTSTSRSETIRTTIAVTIERCNSSSPNQPHPTDCRAFYQCVDGLNGIELVEKNCGPGMMYNPTVQICDWPANVIAARPACGLVSSTPSSTTRYTTESRITSPSLCTAGESWSDCAVPCNRTCKFYNHQLKEEGLCVREDDCIPGCTKNECSRHLLWRDAHTCVDIADCPCKSHQGHLVKPGGVVKESECEICQCLGDYYTCDTSHCTEATVTEEIWSKASTSTASPQTEPPKTTVYITDYTILVTSHVSSAEECLSKHYLPLRTSPLESQMSFSASSVLNKNFDPKYWKLNDEVDEVESTEWQPLVTDKEQWLSVEFLNPEAVYGLIIRGSIDEDKYVTSYKVLFSEDGLTFSYILNDEGKSKVFRGPSDSKVPVRQILHEPIEAKVIKINPQSWHKGIAMRVDVLGCDEHFTTPTETYHPTTETPVSLPNHTHTQVKTTPHIHSTKTTMEFEKKTVYVEETTIPVCDEPMGYDKGVLSDDHVQASSVFNNSLSGLRISMPGVWRPKLDNPHQYVAFDFLEARDLTGLETLGSDGIWTSIYKVYYSMDGRSWNPVVDSTGADREFLGNFDDTSTRINHFDRPIHARYLKINPVKWHKHVGLKAEVHGCFLPYTIAPTPSVPKTSEPKSEKMLVTVEKPKCNVCDGIIEKTEQACRCMEMYWWNGETCVTKHECPCVVGSIPYAVGTRFETDDCQECICSLGGVAACQQKSCPPCSEPGLRSIVTELCSCVCKPCAPGERLCSANNVCMNETLWCNGVENCPGDENDCEAMTPKRPFPTMVVTTGHTTTINHTTVVTLDVKKVACEKPVCSKGYKLVSYTVYPSTKSAARKGHSRSSTKGGTKTWRRKKTQPRTDEDSNSVDKKCPEFSCIPHGPPPGRPNRPGTDSCPKVECPPGYKVIFVQLSMRKLVACPKYTCYPPPPVEVVCNVTGRTFNTFDNLEYKYDICNHILARYLDDNRWYITLEKHCPQHISRCTQVLSITMDDDDIVLYPDMHVDIGDYTFTSKQINALRNNRGLFKISLIGDVLYFVSNKYGFWVIWDKNSNVKIGVTTRLATHVDGLCGYFDGNPRNDRQKPDGTPAKNTLDFGSSWTMDNAPQCEQQVCPPEIHQRAWEICGIVKDTSLRAYSEIINLDKFISRCMETTCTCILGNATEEDCRCRALLAFVTDCQAAEQSADLSTWRTILNCPIQCPAPFVHKDCFRKKCEISCSNLQEADPCPVMPGVCFSGCFCPDGMVRHGEDCVYASECRDCVCNGFGNSKFVTFDKRNFTFQGNCTYTLSRDFNKAVTEDRKNHTYEILMTNVPCEKGVCTEAITVLYGDHVIQIRKSATNDELEPVIDGFPKTLLPYKNDWLSLEDGQNHNLIVLIPAIQLEVTIFHHNFAFTIKLPSHTFGGATEGLCGNCNGIIEDDLKTKSDEITEDINAFGMSWLANDQPAALALNDHCTSEPPKQCNQETVDLTPCKILEDLEPFGKCHDLIDPTTYIDSCKETVCLKGDVCGILEAYARSCLQAGLCLSWRTADVCPYSCPPELEYQACGSGCKRTCDPNLKPDNCLLAPTEGCFCPEHHVFHNGSCVPEKNCLICDEEGHVNGDVWNPDKCTSCSCANKTVTCQKTDCPALDAVCEDQYTPVSVPGSEEHCCPKYFCVPVPTTAPTCIEPQQPECGFGQRMKVTVGGDGCQKIICECVPTEACPTAENDIEFDVEVLLPGYEQVMNTTGCCPRLTRICRPETCPSVPTCLKYHEIVSEQRPNSCCPDYECKPLKNICLITTLTNNDLPTAESMVGKEIGEVWKEDNCKNCTCESSSSGSVINCITSQCPDYRDSAEAKEFVLEEKVIESECCPTFKRKACRHGENVYRVGDKWHSDPTDVCKIVECVNVMGKIEKKDHIEMCNMDCGEGYEYRVSKNKSANCCGECIAIACLVDTKIRNIGERWYSTDHCVTYSCLSESGRIFVKETTESCPEIDPIEATRFKLKQVTIPHQCCKKNVREACIYEDMVYDIGEKWMLKNDSCVTEMCANGPDGVTVQQETKFCDTMCRKGWTYEGPPVGECCGECKQTMCIADDKLYEPGAVWYSNDNCTTFTCSMQSDQLVVTSSAPICPGLEDCPERSVYFDGCCPRCNITQLNQQQACAAEVLDLDITIGILVEKHHKHGICRNLQAIKGLTECRGSCSSSTQFDTESWKQLYNCECCQPREMQTITVQLSCDDGKLFNREITVPTSCSCQACGSQKNNTKGRRKNVKV